MYKYSEISRKEFFDKIDNLTYAEGDELEAKALGQLSVKELYKNNKQPYQRYFIVYDDINTYCTIVLKRDGSLEYFITDKVTPYKIPTLVRTVKQLADETVERVGPIFTNTLEAYKGAIRFNELVGFRRIATNNIISKWVYEGSYGWK